MKITVAEWLHWPETKAIIKAFGEAPVRFVGGAVRDCLLDISVNDVDLATALPPEKVSELLSAAGIKVFPTGIAHGTVTAVVAGRNFEITTLRRDVSTDGRRAVVAYTDDWREDASRRDFTMNALYCDARGEITDYFGGVEDAKSGRVRFIGDPAERINEDALRILRFFRFTARYGKSEMDKDALAACRAQAAKIDTLSGERIQQEMFKLLVADKSADVIFVMQEQGILRHVIPAEIAITALKQLPGILNKADVKPDPILALVLLLRSSSGNFAEAISTRWKLSRAHSRLLSDLCASRINITGDEFALKKQIRACGKALFILQAIAATAEGEDGLPAVKLAQGWNIPMFPLTGGDLLELGMRSGKEMGLLLARLETQWEDAYYRPGKKELIEMAIKKPAG